jgi:hypothetical protein
MARLDGTLTWRGVVDGNPSAPDVGVRLWFRPDGEAGWALFETDPSPPPEHVRVDPLPQARPWKDEKSNWLGLEVRIPDDPVNWVWDLTLQPHYARYGDWEPL